MIRIVIKYIAYTYKYIFYTGVLAMMFVLRTFYSRVNRQLREVSSYLTPRLALGTR